MTTESNRRDVDWYETFFDLVFVAVVAVAVHIIEVETSVGTVAVFVLLLFPLWWGSSLCWLFAQVPLGRFTIGHPYRIRLTALDSSS